MVLGKMPAGKLQTRRAEVEARIASKVAERREELQSQISELLKVSGHENSARRGRGKARSAGIEVPRTSMRSGPAAPDAAVAWGTPAKTATTSGSPERPFRELSKPMTVDFNSLRRFRRSKPYNAYSLKSLDWSVGARANRTVRVRGNSHTRRLANERDHKRKFSREYTEFFLATASPWLSRSPWSGKSQGFARSLLGLPKSWLHQGHRRRVRASGISGDPPYEQRCTRRSVASATAPKPCTPLRRAEFLRSRVQPQQTLSERCKDLGSRLGPRPASAVSRWLIHPGSLCRLRGRWLHPPIHGPRSSPRGLKSFRRREKQSALGDRRSCKAEFPAGTYVRPGLYRSWNGRRATIRPATNCGARLGEGQIPAEP